MAEQRETPNQEQPKFYPTVRFAGEVVLLRTPLEEQKNNPKNQQNAYQLRFLVAWLA